MRARVSDGSARRFRLRQDAQHLCRHRRAIRGAGQLEHRSRQRGDRAARRGWLRRCGPGLFPLRPSCRPRRRRGHTKRRPTSRLWPRIAPGAPGVGDRCPSVPIERLDRYCRQQGERRRASGRRHRHGAIRDAWAARSIRARVADRLRRDITRANDECPARSVPARHPDAAMTARRAASHATGPVSAASRVGWTICRLGRRASPRRMAANTPGRRAGRTRAQTRLWCGGRVGTGAVIRRPASAGASGAPDRQGSAGGSAARFPELSWPRRAQARPPRRQGPSRAALRCRAS